MFKKEKFSYSRVGCFTDCPLKYKYRYVNKIKASGVESTLANKGLVFHEMAETWKVGNTKEWCLNEIKKLCVKHNVDFDEWPYEESVGRWLCLQETFIQPKINEGFKEFHELWINGTVAQQSFCGAIDNILIGDDKIYIIDYKTGKSTSTSGYRKQLMLYAWFKGKEHFKSTEDLADKVELWVFFPLGEVAKTKYKTIEEKTGAAFVQVLYSQEELEENFRSFDEKVKDIISKDFDKVRTVDAKTSYGCQWCDYRGSIAVPGLFEGCPKSYEEGLRQSRSTKFSN